MATTGGEVGTAANNTGGDSSSRPRGGDSQRGRGRGGRGSGGGGRGRGRGGGGGGGAGGGDAGSRPAGRGRARGGGHGHGRGGHGEQHTQQPADQETKGKLPAFKVKSEEEDDDAEVCFICANPISHHSIAPCNHNTCHICALRLRALYKNKDCPHCRVSISYLFSNSFSFGGGQVELTHKIPRLPRHL